MDKTWVCKECNFYCSLMAGFYVNGEVPRPTHCPYNKTPAWHLLCSNEDCVTPVVNLDGRHFMIDKETAYKIISGKCRIEGIVKNETM